METANIGNYKATEDWYYIVPATLLVDVIVIFFTRYASSIAGKSLNKWYDDFGLAAVLSEGFEAEFGAETCTDTTELPDSVRLRNSKP
jgi:hypothetical protein